MPTLSEAAIIDALRHVQEPELGRDIVSLEMVKSIVIDGTNVAFTIELTTPACPLKDEIESNARAAIHALGATGKPAVPTGPISQFDGAELNLAQIDEQRYETQARWLTANVAFWPHVMTLVMNRSAFDALTPSQRAILRRAAAVALQPR